MPHKRPYTGDSSERLPTAHYFILMPRLFLSLSRLSGDYNPLHATPEPGQKLGFGGIIMHGLHTWNATANVVLREFGRGDSTKLKDFQARFKAPVRPSAELRIKMWSEGRGEDGVEDVRFVTEVGDVIVLDNGRALIQNT